VNGNNLQRSSIFIALCVGIFFSSVSIVFADSWDLSGGGSIDTTGCYANGGSYTDSEAIYTGGVANNYIVRTYTPIPSIGKVTRISPDNNFYGNTTMSGSGAYATGSWSAEDAGSNPAPTFTYYPDTDDCTGDVGGDTGTSTATSTQAYGLLDNNLVFGLFLMVFLPQLWGFIFNPFRSKKYTHA